VASELKGSLGVETKLIEGGRGIFDVKVDGKLVFSKNNTKRFPEQGEVSGLVQGG